MFRHAILAFTVAGLIACAGPYGDGFFDAPPEVPGGPLGGEPGGPLGGEPGGAGGGDATGSPTAWPAVAEAMPLEGDVCLWNSDCPADAYCRRPAGRCYGLGVCQRPAEDCGPDDPPVCACTGESLPNRCAAAARGTNVAYLGVCGAICTARADCPAGDVCRKAPERVVNLDGTCGPPPSDCGQVNPICTELRDDEVANECQAMQDDTWVDGPGPCGACLDAGHCYTGDYQGEAMDVCDLPVGTCGQRVLGRCRTIWDNDLCEWNIGNGDPEPVCGCDGRTYAAACRAAWNGARVDHAGECEPLGP